jgi:4-hydroxy-2-oxoheptanedioate aldolase
LPPYGKRGLGSPFSVHAFGISEIGEYLSQVNENAAVIIQIETLEVYKIVEDIVKVDGADKLMSIGLLLTVDVLVVGLFDLSNALGHPIAHGTEYAVVKEAIQRVLHAPHRAGKKAGIFTVSGEDVRNRVDQGFDMVHIGADVNALISGIQSGVGATSGNHNVPMEGGYWIESSSTVSV